MAYLLKEYLEISRMWSVLKVLAEGPMSGLSPGFQPTTLNNSNFHARWPVAETLIRPQIAMECLAGDRTGTDYQVILLAEEVNPDQSSAGADDKLAVWTHRVIETLHGHAIPFYDWRDLASPKREKAFDFVMDWVRFERQSERAGAAMNLSVVRFRVKAAG